MLFNRDTCPNIAICGILWAKIKHGGSSDKSIHLTLVTPEGIAKNEYRWDVQSEVTLDDLFRP